MGAECEVRSDIGKYGMQRVEPFDRYSTSGGVVVGQTVQPVDVINCLID